MEKKDTVRKVVYISRKQDEFLSEHEEINLSGLVRQTLNEIMKGSE